LKLTNDLIGCRIRQIYWPADEWIEVEYIGRDFAIGTNEKGKEVILPYDKESEEWLLCRKALPPEERE